MKAALHESISLADGNVAEVFAACTRRVGFADAETVTFSSSIDLIDEAEPSRKSVLDIVIAPFRLSDTSIVSALEEVRVEFPFVYSIVFDKNPEQAAFASEAFIDGFLVEPVSRARFEEELMRVFKSLARLHAASFVLNSCVGYRRIPFHSVYYCETSGHDQVLYLEDGRTLNARYSSQALFDLLSKDGRFFKVGSSYIVNLNEVDEVNTPAGTLTLSNGTKLSVPFRVRKPLERTLLNW